MDMVKGSEPRSILHYWSALSAIATASAGNSYIAFNAGTIKPNLYVIFVGDPGARKSTAIDYCSQALRTIPSVRFSAQRTSKEKFINELANSSKESKAGKKITMADIQSFSLATSSTGYSSARLHIAADELCQFFNRNDLEFMPLIGTLWDVKEYLYSTKSSGEDAIRNPFVTLLGATTKTNFPVIFPPDLVGQGFYSRCIFVDAPNVNTKRVWPTPITIESAEFTKKLANLPVGEITVSPLAKELWTEIYAEWPIEDNSELSFYNTRRHIHLLKVAMLMCLARQATVLRPEDIRLANTLLYFTEHTMAYAIGESGISKLAATNAKIINYLRLSVGPVYPKTIWKLVYNDLESMDRLMIVLTNLVAAGKLVYPKDGTGYRLAPRSRLAIKDAWLNKDFYRALLNG